MENLPTKTTGSQYTAAEFNVNQDERENAVTDSGQTLPGDNSQLSRAISITSAGADYYDDSGAINAYVLSRSTAVSFEVPEAYYEGMRIRFRPTNNNTGASTVNVATIGITSILKEDGVSALLAGDLTTARDAECRYDITAGAFLLLQANGSATKSSQGLTYLGDQRIILENSSGDPTDDIYFSGGLFTFDDGSGSAIAPAYTKQINFAFVAGNNQGGRIGTLGNNWYYCFAIYSPSTGDADYIMANTLTPTLPGTYTKKRYIGSVWRQIGANVQFIQIDKTFYLLDPANLYSGAPFTGTQVVYAPLGLIVEAIVYASIFTRQIILSLHPVFTTAPLGNLNSLWSSGNWSQYNNNRFIIPTNTSGQIGVTIVGGGTGSGDLEIDSYGYIDKNLED